MNRISIAVGVTGSIAAYKSAVLVSTLMKNNFDVNVIMTESAKQFIGKQTFLTLSRNPVVDDLWSTQDWKPGHISLADRISLFVVAPCSANFIGKYTNGIADDPITTFALAFDGDVMIAPAMNVNMWKHPAVQDNIKILKKRGVNIIGPATGLLACGIEAEGKMSEPEVIYSEINKQIKEQIK